VSLLNLYQFGVLSVILAWTTSGFAGSLEDAVAAWRQRDVAKAFELLRPLAEQGVAQAQWRLGMIYLTEQKNDAEAR
jgi:TPR repeat protein